MQSAEAVAVPLAAHGQAGAGQLPALVEACRLSRSFGSRRALVDVSLAVSGAEVHALLGPNGAGKTTLLRILAGMIRPDTGTVTVGSADATRGDRAQNAAIGLVPSGDRSFYLRISGLENLVFFARLHGMRARTARRRALEVLAAVGLDEAARQRVGEYSHGMQKRLSVARALLMQPRVLLVDEATHDLDPHAARVVRELVGAIAAEGAAVVWATQRIDEIRGFAHRATLLRAGEICYAGSVSGLAARVRVASHIVRLRLPGSGAPPSLLALRRHLGAAAAVDVTPEDPELFVLDVDRDASLGEALGALLRAGVDIVSCREAQSEIEEAFVQLTSRR